jgi:hypothetical protein
MSRWIPLELETPRPVLTPMSNSPAPLTAAELRAFATRCEARQKQGLHIHPDEVTLIVEALRALADVRERDKRTGPTTG